MIDVQLIVKVSQNHLPIALRAFGIFFYCHKNGYLRKSFFLDIHHFLSQCSHLHVRMYMLCVVVHEKVLFEMPSLNEANTLSR